MSQTSHDPANLANDLIDRVVRAGADAADAIVLAGRSTSVAVRLGQRERLEHAEHFDVGLRVFRGRRQAIVSTADISASALDVLVERAVAAARVVPEDPYCGIASREQLAASIIDCDSVDAGEPTTPDLLERATAAEDAALAVEGITNSEGGEAGWSSTQVTLAASNGFCNTYRRSGHSLSVSAIAGTGTEMQRDYDYTAATHAEDLRDATAVGRTAGERALRRLNPRKVASAQVPVIFDPRTARSLLGHLVAAVNGSSVARGTTFLKEKMGSPIFAPSVTIVDDPLRSRGLRSRPFDGEGLSVRTLNIVDQGILKSWILDLRSARQLDLESTGHASRGVSSPPSPSSTNLYMKPGSTTPQALMADIKNGLYVTELIGFGVNGVTGDYSRGASGFWVVDGEPAYPVAEVTIAGNLLDMFATLSAANDLEFRYGTDSPTVRVEGMTVAGQ